MARRQPEEAGHTLMELQSFSDKAGDWLRENWMVAAGIVGAVLLVTALVAGLRAWHEQQELDAASAMAAVEREFLQRMGAEPGARGFQEPANPQVGLDARRDAATRLLDVAREHGGTEAAALARLQAGQLLLEAGNEAKAIETWQALAASDDLRPDLAAMVQVRIAQAEEARGRWQQAAEAYAAAGADRGFPLWAWALADAARAWVEAGDRAEAVRLAEQIRAEAPALELPPHLAAQLDELRATGADAS